MFYTYKIMRSEISFQRNRRWSEDQNYV